MRGRPPKSIEQHRRGGTLNVTRHKVVPLLVGGRSKPTCPRHLTGEAHKAHKALVQDLWDSRFPDAGDRFLTATGAVKYSVAMCPSSSTCNEIPRLAHAPRVWLA